MVNNPMPRKFLERPLETERLPQTVAPPSVPAPMQSYSLQPPVSGDPASLSHLGAMLWRGRWIILPGAIAGLAAGLILTTLMAPVYRARTSVQIESFNDQTLGEVTAVSSNVPNASPENYLQNEVKLLESDSLARKVADALPPVQPHPDLLDRFMHQLSTGFGYFPDTPVSPDEARIRAIQNSMDVRTTLNSQVIELFFDAGDPQRAAMGANTAANAFIAMHQDARSQMVQDTTAWLNKQANDMRARIDAANRSLEQFAQASGLVFAEKESTLAEDQMLQVQDALSKAQSDRAEKQARYEAAVANPQNLVTDPMPTGPLRQYQVDLQTLQRTLAQLKTQFTSDYYKVQQTQSQIAETQAAIEKERTELLGRMRVDYLAAVSYEHMLQDQHAKQLKTVQQQMENERRYNTQKSEVDAMEHIYEGMLGKAKEAAAASALRATNVRVIDPAMPPSSPYSPRPAINAAIGLAFGLICAVGFVFVRGESDRFKGPGESPLPEVPELGVIPAASTGWVPNGNRRLIAFGKRAAPGLVKWNEDDSMLTESFRAALTSILFGPSAKRDSGGQVLVVTSANMMEGKTTVIANLGIASAERRRRVLLIDADLRRPQLHAAFKLSNERGLANVLEECNRAGSCDGIAIDHCIQRGSIPGLYVMTAGPSGNSNLLYTADLEPLLDRLRREFDLVFIDTPPMMLYSDSRVLGRMSDGVVMVVRADSTRGDELRASYMRLMQDQIPVIGTILNKWRMDATHYRAYGRYYTNGAPKGV